jgi:uncharacterized glyoxalase superfamily protein PhnB
MLANRSVPPATVMPVLVYDDIAEAVEWLCAAFGFRERLRIGDHRSQLMFGDGAIVLGERRQGQEGEGTAGIEFRPPRSGEANHSLLVRVEDAEAHCEHARSHGARILRPPTDHPFGERQYTAEDLAGHLWTFSQSIADVAPEDWGATTPG